ncbi:DUF6160 family protein, partial [Alcanivorax sp. HI0083]|uniref:DUF6160 family protein n=2 Tax=Alcanivorax TaxID=59753 RepID=UPI0012E7DC15
MKIDPDAIFVRRKFLHTALLGVLTAVLMSTSLAFPVLGHAMEALEEQEMGAITGQEGVMVSIEYYYNSVRTDDPSTTGQGLSSCGGPSDLGNMNCRLAWQLANRGDAGASGIYSATNWNLPGGGGCDGAGSCKGEWLVWKAGWASLAVNGLMLDA